MNKMFDEADELMEAVEEFPTKSLKRRERYVKAQAIGKRRLAVRNAVYGREALRDMSAKESSKRYAAKNSLLKSMPDIWGQTEEIAPAAVRRRMEAMDQEERYHRAGSREDDERVADLYYLRGRLDTEADAAYWDYMSDAFLDDAFGKTA